MPRPEWSEPVREAGIPSSPWPQARLKQLRERQFGSSALIVSGDEVLLTTPSSDGSRVTERWRRQRGCDDLYERIEITPEGA